MHCILLPGQPPPRADAVAVNNSIIHAGVIRDSIFDGNVNISVGGSSQITTGKVSKYVVFRLPLLLPIIRCNG